MLRPSFVPPAEVRALRWHARTRTRLVQDRTRCWQRIEKLLEDALIKVSSVASKLATLSVLDMLGALTEGERDPQVLAGLARGRMKAKHDALVPALEGRFEDRHADPQAWGADSDGVTGPAAGTATFLGERHARIARRRGKAKAQGAVARTIAVIIWHLLNDRDTRYRELGPGHYQNRLDKNRATRNHVRQLEALGYTVTLTQTAA